MPPGPTETDSETRWQAWVAKGRVHDLHTREKVKTLGMLLLVLATLSLAAVLAFR